MKSILTSLRGAFSILIYAINTVACCIPIFAVALVRSLVPIRPVQTFCRRLLTGIASCWIWVNNMNQRLSNGIRWDVQGLDGLDPRGWYMVVANHQSWVDILVLQNVFHGKIPFLKFFLKKELFWFPLLGQAWWALDFPFMKRYSRRFLRKHPHLIGKDLEITRKACEKFRSIPVSVMNFVEGTRFTREKHSRQRSPYTHLLRTKAGGLAFAMAAMGDKFQEIVDVTIAYPQGVSSFWDFVCGRVKEIRVRINILPVSSEMMGDYLQDAEFKRNFQDWLNRLWQEKDQTLDRLLVVNEC
ncbi:acyltransferase [Desulfosarcina ovata subsp. sediminis]|uniref:Acyltransferase n=1 Tax=Desulfosarcina ovata subsp. sediminis TaxID=885957 RepID=A0A5K7ZML7_9BACT|nr:acyltransferase [Desulfosarcina ovata]BBO82804.1 acyltransferase [Desulfosarcina ovata subsp. sediminis]